MDSTIFKATAAPQVVNNKKVAPEWNTEKVILIVNALPPVREMYIARIVMHGNVGLITGTEASNQFQLV